LPLSQLQGTVSQQQLQAINYCLQVDVQDLGRVIGRQGRTARALRTLVGVAGEKLQKRALLQILE
jgi:predicted RNA-binding protein YlqC (UPF0109 family)